MDCKIVLADRIAQAHSMAMARKKKTATVAIASHDTTEPERIRNKLWRPRVGTWQLESSTDGVTWSVPAELTHGLLRLRNMDMGISVTVNMNEVGRIGT